MFKLLDKISEKIALKIIKKYKILDNINKKHKYYTLEYYYKKRILEDLIKNG